MKLISELTKFETQVLPLLSLLLMMAMPNSISAYNEWTTSMEPVEFELVDREAKDTLKLRIPKAYLINADHWAGGPRHIITVKFHIPDLIPWTVYRSQQKERQKRGEEVISDGWDESVVVNIANGKVTDEFIRRYPRMLKERMKPGSELIPGLEHIRRYCYVDARATTGEKIKREKPCAADNDDYFLSPEPTKENYVFIRCIPVRVNDRGGCQAQDAYRAWGIEYIFRRTELPRWAQIRMMVRSLIDGFAAKAVASAR